MINNQTTNKITQTELGCFLNSFFRTMLEQLANQIASIIGQLGKVRRRAIELGRRNLFQQFFSLRRVEWKSTA